MPYLPQHRVCGFTILRRQPFLEGNWWRARQITPQIGPPRDNGGSHVETQLQGALSAHNLAFTAAARENLI